MNLGEIMSPNPVLLRPGQSIRETVALFWSGISMELRWWMRIIKLLDYLPRPMFIER